MQSQDGPSARRWRGRARAWAGKRLPRWPFSTLPLQRLAGRGGRQFTTRLGLGAGVVLAIVLAWPAADTSRHRAILDAIRLVESGGRDDCPDGDGGLAIGPYQIHRVYWQDAVAHDPRLGPRHGFGYEDCRRRGYAEQVIEAYMRRWVPSAWQGARAEVIARTHNGGPKGATSPATSGYWRRVRAHLGLAGE